MLIQSDFTTQFQKLLSDGGFQSNLSLQIDFCTLIGAVDGYGIPSQFNIIKRYW